jgi:hypothetical protein
MEQGIEVIPDDTGPVLVVNGLHVELEGLHEH